ncbi:hypothetical protein R1flu_003828 [Riccia fluitans]|uniref:WD repeat-containing protein 48 n=1 Tax=Riccia fluitans TaxID=41844 RepID=A0ABD1YA37_9MARC
MHRVGSTGNTANTTRPRKEKRFTYVLRDSNDYKHCSGINCVKVGTLSEGDGKDFLVTGSRDGTIKRWDLSEDPAVCRATFESHVDWVNDVVLTGDDTLVSCSSDTTLKTWRLFSSRECTRTFRHHSDYVTALASAKHSNIVASGGLGCEVFIWDLEAAMTPIAKVAHEGTDEGATDGSFTPSLVSTTVDRPANAKSDVSTPQVTPPQDYAPILAKGHKESIYALSMNDAGTTLVSGGTEKAVRVWDPRTGTKQMKLKGHTDNVRALRLDPTGRYCLSGSSDSMIRLWDLGQQRCVHSYAVHTDSVWALASTPSFSHVYSGGRDLSVYLTDLSTRESILLCTEREPVLQLALQGDEWLWVATTDSSLNKWPARERMIGKKLQRASSFVAGSLPFARVRACLDGSAPVPLHSAPASVIPGTAGIVRHAILNDRRHVLTKDAQDVCKLWEITRGSVIKDFGKVNFEEKEKELFEKVSVPAWFTMDTRLGSISVHLDTPQCFSAEMYAVDLQVPNATEEQKLNLGQETLRGLLDRWLSRRQQKAAAAQLSNGDVASVESGNGGEHGTEKRSTEDSHDDPDAHKSKVIPAFEFSTSSPPSIITEGSVGGPWRKKATDLDGTEDEKELPLWCIDCVLHSRLPPRDNAKCSFFLLSCEGTSLQVLTQGKLSAPRILRIHKVVNYVLEKLVLDRPVDDTVSDSTSTSGQGSNHQSGNSHASSRQSSRVWQQQNKPVVEILCNNQVLPPEMSLATVRAYVWKKPDDLTLYYRTVPSR